MPELAELIRAVPDYPSPGILFRDITPLLLDPDAFRKVIEEFASAFEEQQVDRIAAVESRGFLFGAPLAAQLRVGLAPVRKVGKLPRATCSREYALEYGSSQLEMHRDAVEPGQRVLIVDDVVATGGTARAAAEIVEELGGIVVAIASLVEITGLGGRDTLEGYEVWSLLEY